MRLAIINYTGGGMSGGYKNYLKKLLPRIAIRDDVEAILCATPEAVKIDSLMEGLKNVTFTKCRPFNFLNISSDLSLFRNLEEFSPDILFIPVERYLNFKDVPVVNLIQNMEPFVSNGDFNPLPERLRQLLKYLYGKRAIKKSDGIIALSKFVVGMLKIRSKNKIKLIYHGIDQNKFRQNHKPSNISDTWVGKFVFTAGSIRCARGLEDILSAINYIKTQKNHNVKLVIAGKVDLGMQNYKKKLVQYIVKNNLSSEIHWVGNINEQEMNWCYKNCSMFVMTSRVESFGMIAGEAMANGCLCISSSSPCLPEIFNNSALFYEKNNFTDLGDKILKVLNLNQTTKEEMSLQAVNQSKQFSWDICADRTVDFLKHIISSHKS